MGIFKKKSNSKDKINFVIKENVSYNFNINDFLERECEIYKKFIPPTVNNYLSEKLEKLFINYLEEKIEADTAYNFLIDCLTKYKYKDIISDRNTYDIVMKYLLDYKFELIDMFCYNGTMLVAWSANYDDYPMEFTNKIMSQEFNNNAFSEYNLNLLNAIFKDFKENKFVSTIITNHKTLTEISYYDIINEFIKLRRKFPERKWHKVKNPLSSEDEFDLIGKPMKKLLLYNALNLLFNLIFLEAIELYINMNYNNSEKHTIDLSKIIKILELDIYNKQQVTLDL